MGMAVDANILIFERMKEEIRRGRELSDAIHEGFIRAWNSIRDGNCSGLIASVILFWLGTSLVKGFALTLGIGILVSMFTAVVVARTYLLAISVKGHSPISKFLFSSGFRKVSAPVQEIKN
jgi:preprotein translocase subunit SecD